MKSGDVVNRTGQGPIVAPPVFGDWERMQKEADRDDPYKNIPAAEVVQPQSTSVTYVAPAISAAPVVLETPLVIAARNVESASSRVIEVSPIAGQAASQVLVGRGQSGTVSNEGQSRPRRDG